MATATLAGQGDGAENEGACFIHVQEGHRVKWGHLAARLLQENQYENITIDININLNLNVTLSLAGENMLNVGVFVSYFTYY